MASRTKLLLENFISAKKEGRKTGDFDIALVRPDSLEEYYILLRPTTGIYKDQYQVLHMKTTYGNDPRDRYTYPVKAPLLQFVTGVYHTNISTTGSICLDILKDPTKWMPTYDFTQVIINIMLLYQDPNNSSPYNGDASRDYVDCEKIFKQQSARVKELKEIEEIKEQAFRPFKEKADRYAAKNKIDSYAKWFPQIVGGQYDDSAMIELEAQLSAMKAKKKTNAVDKSSAAASAPAAAPAVDAKPKRWEKYQKKPQTTA